MKLLSTDLQEELLSFFEDIEGSLNNVELENRVQYWLIELKPKRVRRKIGLNLNTEEGVIEQAYQEHTGNI